MVKNALKTGAKYYGYYNSITSFVLSIVLFCIGVYIAFIYQFKRTVFTNAVIVNDVECDKNMEKKQSKYNCLLLLHYSHNGIEYTNNYTVKSSKKYRKNDKMTIRYNPNDPNSFDNFPMNPVYIGYFLMVISMLICLYSVVCYLHPVSCGVIAAVQNVGTMIRN